MTIRMEGIIPPLVTPFAKDGSINENMFRRIINNVLDNLNLSSLYNLSRGGVNKFKWLIK